MLYATPRPPQTHSISKVFGVIDVKDINDEYYQYVGCYICDEVASKLLVLYREGGSLRQWFSTSHYKSYMSALRRVIGFKPVDIPAAISRWYMDITTRITRHIGGVWGIRSIVYIDYDKKYTGIYYTSIRYHGGV